LDDAMRFVRSEFRTLIQLGLAVGTEGHVAFPERSFINWLNAPSRWNILDMRIHGIVLDICFNPSFAAKRTSSVFKRG
jgi:hypothetical protein